MGEVTLKCDMMCGGCAGAVKNILEKTPGVDSFDVSWENNRVVVQAGPGFDVDALVAKLNKSGKETSLATVQYPCMLSKLSEFDLSGYSFYAKQS